MVNKGMTMTGLMAMAVGVLSLVVAYNLIPLVGAQLDISIDIPGANYARNTLTITANASHNESVNITLAGVPYQLQYRMTGFNGNANAIPIAMNLVDNSSTIAATNVSSTINANATLAAVLTASNGSAGIVNIIYDTVGTAGNQVGTAETMASGSWASANMTGGTDPGAGSQWNSSINPSIPTAVDLWEALGGILKVAGIIVVVGGFLTTLRGLRG